MTAGFTSSDAMSPLPPPVGNKPLGPPPLPFTLSATIISYRPQLAVTLGTVDPHDLYMLIGDTVPMDPFRLYDLSHYLRVRRAHPL